MTEVDGKRVIGGGIAIYHLGKLIDQLSLPLGTGGEVFHAELVALTTGLEKGIAHAHQRLCRQVHVFLDNSAALQVALSGKPSEGQEYTLRARHAAFSFLQESPFHKVQLGWVPGHCKCTGNEAADRLAGAACKMVQPATPTLSLATAKREAKQDMLEQWKTAWAMKDPSDDYSKAYPCPPSLKLQPHLLRRHKRPLTSAVVQARTGHGFLGSYYHKNLGNKDDLPSACGCGHPMQNRCHLLLRCPYLEPERHLLDSAPGRSVAAILGTVEGVKAFIKFVAASGAFTKTGNVIEDLPQVKKPPDKGAGGKGKVRA